MIPMSGEGEFHEEVEVRNWRTLYVASALSPDGCR